jgi:hypothetical protein
LRQWSAIETPCDPADERVILIEAGDTLDNLSDYLSLLVDVHDEDFVPPSEWVQDHGACLEMYIALGDESGCSLILPRATGTDPILLELFEAYCTPLLVTPTH